MAGKGRGPVGRGAEAYPQCQRSQASTTASEDPIQAHCPDHFLPPTYRPPLPLRPVPPTRLLPLRLAASNTAVVGELLTVEVREVTAGERPAGAAKEEALAARRAAATRVDFMMVAPVCSHMLRTQPYANLPCFPCPRTQKPPEGGFVTCGRSTPAPHPGEPKQAHHGRSQDQAPFGEGGNAGRSHCSSNTHRLEIHHSPMSIQLVCRGDHRCTSARYGGRIGQCESTANAG